MSKVVEAQKLLVLKKLKQAGKKGYTSLDAFYDYRIMRLSARIHNLKEDGYVIEGEMQYPKNERKYKLYTINRVKSIFKRTLKGKKY